MNRMISIVARPKIDPATCKIPCKIKVWVVQSSLLRLLLIPLCHPLQLPGADMIVKEGRLCIELPTLLSATTYRDVLIRGFTKLAKHEASIVLQHIHGDQAQLREQLRYEYYPQPLVEEEVS